jgi:hypothetical protein
MPNLKTMTLRGLMIAAHTLAYALLGPDGAVWIFETARTFAARGRRLG